MAMAPLRRSRAGAAGLRLFGKDTDTGSLSSTLLPRETAKGGKTVVLAENQLQHMGAADHVLVLENGRLLERGALAHLSSSVQQRVASACAGGTGQLARSPGEHEQRGSGERECGRGCGKPVPRHRQW